MADWAVGLFGLALKRCWTTGESNRIGRQKKLVGPKPNQRSLRAHRRKARWLQQQQGCDDDGSRADTQIGTRTHVGRQRHAAVHRELLLLLLLGLLHHVRHEHHGRGILRHRRHVHVLPRQERRDKTSAKRQRRKTRTQSKHGGLHTQKKGEREL